MAAFEDLEASRCASVLLVAALSLAQIPALAEAEEDALKPLTAEELNRLDPAEASRLPAHRVLPAMETSEQQFYAVLEAAFLELRYLFAPPTGRLSPALTAAVKAFQKDIRHKETGTLLMGEFDELMKRLNKIGPIPIYLGNASVIAVGDRARASGTWVFESDTQANPIQTTVIDCDRRLGTCSDATAIISYQQELGLLDVHLETWNISKWSDSEIVAESDQAQCVAYTLSINLQAKKASMFRRGKGIPGCEAFSTSPQILRLVDGFDISNEFFQKRNEEANRLRNPSFK